MRVKFQLYFIIICFCIFGFSKIYATKKIFFQNQQIKKIATLYVDSDILYNNFQFEEAKQLYQKNLDTIIAKYNKNSQETVYGLYKLASCEFDLGNYCIADSLLSEATQIQDEIDSTSLMAGRLWYKISETRNMLCDCKETIPIAEKAVSLLEKHLGENNPEVAYALEMYGFVLAHDYRYNESVEILKRALRILEDCFGHDSYRLARTLSFLARVSNIQYDTETGYPYIHRALQNIKENDFESNRYLADVYYRYAFLHYVKSDYEDALKAALLSVEASQNSFGENHPKTGNYSSLLSRIYLKLGKYELAEPLMLNIKKIFEKTYEYKNPVLYYSYVNLGELYISQGRFDDAEFYFSQCLNIPNIKKSFRIGILENLAEIYFELGEFSKVEELCDEIILFRKKQHGNYHPSIAFSLKLLAKVYSRQNNFMTAQKTYYQILDIFKKKYGENSLYVASTLFDFSQLYTNYNMPEKAIECLRKTISIRTKELLYGHPLIANSYLELAASQLSINRIDSSFENMLKGLENRRDFITHVFQYASSEQKLLYTKDHPLIYDPLIVLATKYNSDKFVKAASEMILNGKGLVIDALSVDKAITACEDDSEISLLVERYSDICTRISALALSLNNNVVDESNNNMLEVLYKTRDSLEAELSMSCAIFNLSANSNQITIQDISSLLPENSLYIDYVKYYPYMNDKKKTNYLAYIIEEENKVSIVDLGSSDIIDNLILSARDKIKESKFQLYSKQSILLEENLQKTTNNLYNILIKPFIKQLEGKEKILISPDSDLNLIPFEIFATDNKEYLIEKYEICYLSSGRDMIQKIDNPTGVYDFIVLASPDFDSKNKSQQFIQSTSVSKRITVDISPQRSMISQTSCFENSFSPLVYSKDEGQQLINLFKKNYTNEKALLYYNKDATSTVLSQLQRPPRFVHLSTHGFFCQENSEVYIKNPLLRSGLAFTGANFKIDNETRTPYIFDDGLLTALEVTGLNLVGTELVTLSACETGIGETVSGEGVFGLRRAFQIAGAKSILMSMWKIPDKETSDLMIKFYTKLFSGSSKQKALRESVLETLKELRKKYKHGHPYLWGGFILTGSPN